MKYKYSILLPIIQCCLVTAAVITDLSIDTGTGEGRNQIISNLLTNVEYYIKGFFGYGDIVNYNFRIVTTVLGIFVWLLIGCLIDFFRRSRNKRFYK
ncbi:hypothetical protein [Paenibacillus sp. SN-8-1]|uniref:hypothetical protein n=1 Tax=Paenibacillus sp. SN-8-1 TaxID=3435409 RepID=UPI003D9A1D87